MVWCMAHGDEHSSQPSGEIQPLFRATAQDDESVAQMVALLDYQDALPSARRLHDWALETAGIQPGDHVVDLGSGTGTMSLQLASLVAPLALAGAPFRGSRGATVPGALREPLEQFAPLELLEPSIF